MIPDETHSIIQADKIGDESEYSAKRNIEVIFIRKILLTFQKISLILKFLPEFTKFFYINRISLDELIKAAYHLKLKSIPKNTCIFNQGQPSEFFYGIIKGSVSIRSQNKIIHLSNISFILRKTRINRYDISRCRFQNRNNRRRVKCLNKWILLRRNRNNRKKRKDCCRIHFGRFRIFLFRCEGLRV